MCPFFILTFIFSLLVLFAQLTSALISVTFHPNSTQLHEGQTQVINFTLQFSGRPSVSFGGGKSSFDQTLLGSYHVIADRADVADVRPEDSAFNLGPEDLKDNGTRYDGSFQIRANFLGYSRMEVVKDVAGTNKSSSDGHFASLYNDPALSNTYQLVVSVIRDKDLMQKIFIYSVAIVVSLSYINFGCALDMDEVKQVLRRPVAPGIGFFSQYVCMPLISYGLATLMFEETYLKLGLFIFGCSPGGGASNMWAVLLGGNLNLSITMTFLSTLLSFAAMPFWLYTLGRTIWVDTTTVPPVRSILTTLGSMLIFLGIGLTIKRYVPRLANVCRRILAPFSVAMIIFIIIFGTYTNLYMFKVMDWRMLVATAGNVWSGMAIGYLLAAAFRKPHEDLVAIAIETGVQNTGVSIVVLGLSLVQPDADLASAVPVAASLMTPIPLTIAYLVIKIRRCMRRGRHLTILNAADSLEAEKEQFKVAGGVAVGNGSKMLGSESCQSNVTILSHVANGGQGDEFDSPTAGGGGAVNSAKASNSSLIA